MVYLRNICIILFFSILLGAESEYIGKEASPVILFKLEHNKYFKSKELLGDKNLVFSFFATWCKPCAQEIPKLHELEKKLGDEYKFILIDVNEKRDKVAKYAQDKGYTIQVILDRYGKIFEAFGGTAMPLTVVVNKKGIITYHHTGYETGDELKLEKHLKTL